ncbi:MAG: pyridoxal phosphate-dependent aminotransferase family protein [Verrucomicrobiota bacterium]
MRQVDRTCVIHRGRKLSYFGGCDYFRLSSHPAVRRALRDGLKRYGLNVAASRMTTGNHELYERLEKQLAKFFGADSALLVSTGYLANLAVAQAMAGSFSHALIDERAHASLQDAAQFLECPVLRFKHRDVADVNRSIQRCGNSARLILLTEGMFSHDGSIAPVKDYLQFMPRDSLVLLDDAHAAGVLGHRGKGTVELANVSRRRIIQTITLSKAFGVYGGAILCTAASRRRLVTKSRLFTGSTPIPLPLAAAALQAVQLIKTDNSLRRRLWANIDYLQAALSKSGLSIGGRNSPILSVIPRSARHALALKRGLVAHGVYPSLIAYPGGPESGYFRFAISSEHSRRQLDELIAALAA